MIKNWKQSFFSAMEKNANPIMSLLMPGMYALDAATQIKENKDLARLDSPKNNAQYKLQPSYAYQFEGGKAMPMKPNVEPYSTMY